MVAHAKHDDVRGTPHCRVTSRITGVSAYLGYSTAWFLANLGGDSKLRQLFANDTGEFVQPDPDWKLTRSNVR